MIKILGLKKIDISMIIIGLLLLFYSYFLVSGPINLACKVAGIGLICLEYVFCLFNHRILLGASSKVKVFFLIAIVIGSCAILNSPYDVKYFLKSILIIAVVSSLTLQNSRLNVEPKDKSRFWSSAQEIFYWSFLGGIIFNMLFLDSTLTVNKVFFFTTIGDQNYTGLFMFLFFAYCFKTKRILGILVFLVFYLTMTASRGLTAMLLVFLMSEIFKEKLWVFSHYRLFNKTWKLLFILFIGTACFSFYWINCVSIGTVSGYRESLNDGSNKLRFSANVYALNRLADEPGLLIYGYGYDLKNIIGIEEEKPYAKHTRFNGVRVVQPHNSTLNLMIKIGILPAICYLLVVSALIDNLRTKQSYSTILAYLFNSCFVHSLFSSLWFVYFIFVLFLENKTSGTKQYLKL